jgi:hypothetical protein
MEVFDDGNGDALYVGGAISTAGGVPTDSIAKWDGANWSGLNRGINVGVGALTTFDDGGRRALCAGGFFNDASGVTVHNIAKWDGLIWSPLGSGTSSAVRSLTSFDDGSGEALYAGGDFSTAGGVVKNIAKWNGTRWESLGSGIGGSVLALAGFDDGGGPALFAGGVFSAALDVGDSYLAKWGCPDTRPPTLDCPTSITAPAPGVVTFVVSSTDDRDPCPEVVCSPPSGSFFTVGVTQVVCTATDASGNQATCAFLVIVPAQSRPSRF